MNDFIKAMNYDFPARIPVTVSILPAAWFKYGQDLKNLVLDYPDLVGPAPDLDKITIPPSYRLGSFTDEWGCVWSNLHEGMEGIVTVHPVPARQDILSLELPKEKTGQLPHGFMYQRLLYLRGFEEAMLDFADECAELQILIDKVLAYNMEQLALALPRMGKIAYFGDDLGMQRGLAIGPQKWRKYLKPCYQKIYQAARASGRYVYMHSDGMIYEIMPDLVECGANMINPQFRANGLANLERVCKGRIPINLDLDRQLFPLASPAELKSHVAECVETLYLPQGGLALTVELNYEVPLTNMAALLDSLRQYQHYKG